MKEIELDSKELSHLIKFLKHEVTRIEYGPRAKSELRAAIKIISNYNCLIKLSEISKKKIKNILNLSKKLR